MITINLSQGDTDRRNLYLADGNGPIDLSVFNVTLKYTDRLGHSFSIIGVEQSPEETNFKDLYAGGVSFLFDETKTAIDGDFIGQIFLTLGTSQTTFPLADYINIKIWKKWVTE